MGSAPSIEDEIFELKFAAHQLRKQVQQCLKDEKHERSCIKRAMEKRAPPEVVRIHGENAIRHRSRQVELVRLASRLDAVIPKLQSAQAMKTLHTTLQRATVAMSHAVKTMDVADITKTMAEFERCCENLEVQGSTIEDTVYKTSAASMPEEEVDALVKEVADEHGLEFQLQLNQISVPSRQEPFPSLEQAPSVRLR